MHNIRTDFRRVYPNCKKFFDRETDNCGNYQSYPRKPALSDVQVVALSCTMEALGIEGENLLWSKRRTDYAMLLPHLICRTRFNWRSRGFQPFIEQVQAKVAESLVSQSEAVVVDSIPIPVVS